MNGMPAVDAMRAQGAAAIRAVIGDCADLTLVRGSGNCAEELCCAGVRSLLSDRRFRELDVDELARAEGRTALLVAGSAFSRAGHDWAPRALAIAERRFERVIVLPGSFELTITAVREGLSRTGATVFARERESYEAIGSLCDARLALDGAFYYDYGPHLREGAGVLDASAAASAWNPASLHAWLERIASCALVRTDRVPVMIAGALLGKQVELQPSSAPELEAIVAYALAELPVRRLAGAPRPTAVHHHPDARVRVVDGAGAGAAELEPADTEFVMLCEPEAELTPSVLQRLAAELDAHPEALAIAARVVDAAGGARAYGGELREWDGVVEFRAPAVPAPALPAACDWVAHAAVMIRGAALAELPLDPAMGADMVREWSYRASRSHPSPFRYCPDAVVVDAGAEPPELPRAGLDADFRTRCQALAQLEFASRFHARHGLVLADVFEVLPTLSGPEGERDVQAAVTLLTLLDALGGDRFLELWARGALDRLLSDDVARGAGELDALERVLADTRAELERTWARLGAIESTRAWRLTTAFYRLRDTVRRS
jgi:hypothetical protein